MSALSRAAVAAMLFAVALAQVTPTPSATPSNAAALQARGNVYEADTDGWRVAVGVGIMSGLVPTAFLIWFMFYWLPNSAKGAEMIAAEKKKLQNNGCGGFGCKTGGACSSGGEGWVARPLGAGRAAAQPKGARPRVCTTGLSTTTNDDRRPRLTRPTLPVPLILTLCSGVPCALSSPAGRACMPHPALCSR